jgi:hypothetical protein
LFRRFESDPGIVIEQCRWEYNHQRPHSILRFKTPGSVGPEGRMKKLEVQPINGAILS